MPSISNFYVMLLRYRLIGRVASSKKYIARYRKKRVFGVINENGGSVIKD
jgi:hypothetical protein